MPKRILVVDDEDEIRDLIVCSLQDEGFEVEQASGGFIALEILKERKFDIILSDLKMPLGDGILILESMRKESQTNPLIYLMTGFSEWSESECLNKGANGMFHKPFKVGKFIETISQKS